MLEWRDLRQGYKTILFLSHRQLHLFAKMNLLNNDEQRETRLKAQQGEFLKDFGG